ncbi:MAG: Gamma-glutamyl phosphate reductase [uncultured Truepera sp.]|uniref:Gamma-glutamyl phosphate reductase n=1 Tax=uncultured Truepera sp. TaxID=543023 RepID=A0A6J4VRC2_9DEIN|nr:MAG: Gamma-glutamyl phosphate reductase [uncultured Truepera sp.]
MQNVTLSRPFDLAGTLRRARTASRALARADRDGALLRIADALLERRAEILAANAEDVAAERAKGTPDALLDRLTLDELRLQGIADAVRQVAGLPDPLHRHLDSWTLPNGLVVRKVSVPFGVIGMVYESRPNVTVDAAVLALRAGSAVVLRGSANALRSNRVLVAAMRDALPRAGLPEDAVQLIDSPDRRFVTELLSARGLVDLVIPRGGASLINHVVETAKVPVIETGTGNCHIFVDASADLERAEAVVLNAKVQRPGVCNAAETLLVHEAVAETFLPRVLTTLERAGVRLVGCERTRAVHPGVGVATEADWETEYLGLELAVRVVASLDEVVDHINRYGTQHSEAILTGSSENASRFQDEVDAAAVFVNASTRFTDGFEFGFGAEIGISTQKLHARGPLGLAEITTYKYLLNGQGQVRR